LISNLEKEITFRYLKTRKKDGFLNVITIFSFIGISLGVAVLIIVMSVMNGFRSDLIKKINGFNSHATIQSYNGQFNLNKIKKDLKDLGVSKIEYLENYNTKTFKKIKRQSKKFKIFIAYYIKNIRLIDNI